LSHHGGSFNAATAKEHTKYGFDVSPDSLYGALDRFAQFFISPLFEASRIEREMKAVDSKNKYILNNDRRRLKQLERHLSNPEHVHSKFGTGNLKTLNIEGIREILIKFYEQFYSANLMKLVIYGRESLDELQSWTEELFSSVKNSQVTRPEWQGQPWDLENKKNLLIQAKTLKEMRSMYITWLIPDQRPYYKTKPEEYLTHLIEHEGEGSLYQSLKTRGWITSLSADCNSNAHGYNFFRISLDLSQSGWENYEEILKWIVQYVSLLRQWGPSERIFEECRQLNEIYFKFREKGDPSTFTRQLATSMQEYQNDPRLILAGPFIIEKFDSACIQDLINHITCDRMRVTRASSDDLEVIELEPWYGTEYQLGKLSDDLLNTLKRIEGGEEFLKQEELKLPEKNIFIPENFKVPISPASSDPLKEPKLLRSGSLNLWHKLDDTFEQPKSQIFVLFRTPNISSSPRNVQLVLLFKDLLEHNLVLYDASLAGLYYEFNVVAEGFEIEISGFTDKLPELLKECLKALKELKFSAIDVEVIKDRQLRSLMNFPRKEPYLQASHHLSSLLTEPNYSIESRVQVLRELKVETVLRLFNEENYFENEIANSGRIEILTHGSIEEEEAKNIANLVEETFKKAQSQVVDDWKQSIVKFERPSEIYFVPPSSFSLDDPNSSVELFFPIGTLDNIKLRTLTTLFAQIFHEPFYSTLRTTEQLGYIVNLGLRVKGILTGIRVSIQSEKDPLYLDSRIEAFLSESVPEILKKMTENDFKLHCSSLKLDLTQKKKTLAGESRQYWNAILSGSNDFLRHWIDSKVLETLTIESVKEFYENYLKPTGKLRTKISVHIWSKLAIKSVSTNSSINIDEIYKKFPIVIKGNRDEFVKSMKLYPCTYTPPRNLK
jgi:insulysin